MASLKLCNEKGVCRKMKFPESFEELINSVKDYVPSLDNSKRYQLIEEKFKREIATQKDFEIMKSDYKNEKSIKIQINIVDKNTKYVKPDLNENQIHQKNMKQIINESRINIIRNNNKKEPNNNDSNPMNEIVKKKLKELEDKLVDELYNNSMMEIEKSKFDFKNKSHEKLENNNEQIHKGIFCNKCGKEIIGKRFKCVQCNNFNLCQFCENDYIHDIKHIMVSIIYPIQNESELLSKLDKNLSYKNQNLNYDIEPKIFYFNSENDVQSQEITIKNIGLESWKQSYLKCIETHSEMVGDDCEINSLVNPGNEIKIKVNFFNIKGQLEEGKNEYFSFFEMFNSKNESFGNVTKIKIIIKNPN